VTLPLALVDRLKRTVEQLDGVPLRLLVAHSLEYALNHVDEVTKQA